MKKFLIAVCVVLVFAGMHDKASAEPLRRLGKGIAVGGRSVFRGARFVVTGGREAGRRVETKPGALRKSSCANGNCAANPPEIAPFQVPDAPQP